MLIKGVPSVYGTNTIQFYNPNITEYRALYINSDMMPLQEF